MDIFFEYRKGILFIRMIGNLSYKKYLELSKRIDDLTEKDGIKFFVINIEKLENYNDYIINMILDKYKKIKLNNGKLMLCYQSKKEVVDERIKGIDNIESELLAFNIIKI